MRRRLRLVGSCEDEEPGEDAKAIGQRGRGEGRPGERSGRANRRQRTGPAFDLCVEMSSRPGQGGRTGRERGQAELTGPTPCVNVLIFAVFSSTVLLSRGT